MVWVLDWLPWIALATIPGLVNTVVAFGELNERCKELPFFEPYKIPGVWLWTAIEFLLPVGIFLIRASLLAKPAIDSWLIFDAVLVYGVGFTALLNAKIKLGSGFYDIKSLYDALVGVAYGMIENNQKRRAAAFWTDIEAALNNLTDLSAGLTYLTNYFAIEVKNPQPEKNYERRLADAATLTPRTEQTKAIRSLLMDVNRRDLIDVLQRFGCPNNLLQTYFPRRYARFVKSAGKS